MIMNNMCVVSGTSKALKIADQCINASLYFKKVLPVRDTPEIFSVLWKEKLNARC